MKKIRDTWGPRKDEDGPILDYDQDDEKRIKNLLLGRKVVKVEDEHMELDNGTVIGIFPNEGCGGCSAGDYWVETLMECDNIITHVEVDCESLDDDAYEPGLSYRIYVVAEDKRINLLDVQGNDGNGYYGTGYRLLVREAT